MSQLRLILNEEIPDDLRAAIDKEAQEDNITVNDAAVRALSDHFQIEPQLSGFQYRPVSIRFKLRVPDALHQLIRIQAAHRLQTVRGVALSQLAFHYGARPIDPGRRPRKVAA